MSMRDPKPRPNGLSKETRARALKSDLEGIEDVKDVSVTPKDTLIVEWFGWSVPASILRTIARHDARLWQQDEGTLYIFVPYE